MSHKIIYRSLLLSILYFSATGSKAQKTEDKRASDWLRLRQLSALSILGPSFLSDADRTTLNVLSASAVATPLSSCTKIPTTTCSLVSLPVTGLKLEGTRMNASEAKLKWETLAEYNSKGFVLERKAFTDSLHFDSVYYAEGKGTSYSKSTYNDIDANSSIYTTYYRVRQIDLDGNFTYSNTVAIEGASFKLAVKVAPNPATENTAAFYILGASSPTAAFTVTNAAGMTLVRKQSVPLSGYTYISLAEYHLARGFYIVSVYTSKEKLSQKLLIE